MGVVCHALLLWQSSRDSSGSRPCRRELGRITSAAGGLFGRVDGSPQVELPVSVDVFDEYVWTIHCREPSTHTFTFETEILGIKDVHVEDSDLSNNSGSTEFTVDAIAEADVKVTGVTVVDPPDEIPVSESVPVTVRASLHNNGPYGPVSVGLSFSTPVVPPDCEIVDGDGIFSINGKQVELPELSAKSY